MSEENMRVARGIGEAFKKGDFDAVGAQFHPEIEWHEDPSFPESSVYRGVDAVASYSQQFRSEFSRIDYEMVELIEMGNHVVANMRITGTGKASGATFEISGWWVFEFNKGQVIRCHSYLDREKALDAAGLRE